MRVALCGSGWFCRTVKVDEVPSVSATPAATPSAWTVSWFEPVPMVAVVVPFESTLGVVAGAGTAS